MSSRPARSPRRFAAIVLTALLLPLVLVGPVPAAPNGNSAAAVTVTVESINPPVASGKASVTIKGRVWNATTTNRAKLTVTVHGRERSVTGADDIDEWLAAKDPAPGADLATTTVGPVAAGGSAPFSLTVKSIPTGGAQWGALPISIDVDTTSVHTFIGFQKRKEFEPAQLAVGLPLLPDANPSLFLDGEKREEGWQTDIRDRLRPRLDAASGVAGVSWLVDSALLANAAPPAPPANNTATASPSAAALPIAVTGTLDADTPAQAWSYADSDGEAQVRNQLRTDLLAVAKTQPLVMLPVGDPDIVNPSIAKSLAPQPASAVTLARNLSAQVPDSTAELAWPQTGTWSKSTEATLEQAYGTTPKAVLLSGTEVEPGEASLGAVRSSASTTTLVSNAGLDGVLTRTAADSGSLLQQEFVARTAGFVAGQPGVSRTLLTVAPRDFAPKTQALTQVLGTIKAIPWVTPTSIPTLMSKPTQPGTATRVIPVRKSPVTTPRAQGVAQVQDLIESSTPMLGDGQRWGPRMWQASYALQSTSWRLEPKAWNEFYEAVDKRAHRIEDGVVVERKTVNFLTDSGRIQVSIANNTSTTVSQMDLKFQPRSRILRITSPTVPVTIGPNSRATVFVDAEALAGGQVPVDVTLAAPDGTVLGESQALTMRVTPSGQGVYWVLAAIVVALFAAGWWRARMRRDKTS